MLLNSSVRQKVKVYSDADDDQDLCYLLAETGRNSDNRGTAIRTSGTTGTVYVNVSTDGGQACKMISQTIPVQQSAGSCIGIVAACNGNDGDNLYDDAYVILTWMNTQPT